MAKTTEQQLDGIIKELKRLNKTLEEISRVYRSVALRSNCKCERNEKGEDENV